MPSKAYNRFTANLKYVNRILGTRKGFSLPSRRELSRLNYINRSALITLCASWEQYIEDVALNSVDVLLQCTDDPLDLPPLVQKAIGTYIKNLPSDLKRLKSATTDLKSTYDTCIKQAVRNFHSPTCKKTNTLLQQSSRVTYKVFSDPKSCEYCKDLDGIIKTRNKMAHRVVRYGKPITQQEVDKNMQIIHRLATNTDNHLHKYLARIHPNRIPPWD